MHSSLWWRTKYLQDCRWKAWSKKIICVTEA